MCVSCLSHCIPASLLERRSLKTTAITLLALGVLALLVGTLASLSLQGTLHTTLSAMGANGVAGFIGGGCLAVLLGYCLYPPKKKQGQRVSFTPAQVTSIRESIKTLSSKEKAGTHTRIFGSTEAKVSVVMLPRTLVPGHFFMKYGCPLTPYVEILGKSCDFFPKENIIASVETVTFNDGEEVAVFKENPLPGLPTQQKDRSLHFQQREEYKTRFGNLLRFICREKLYVGKSLADYFPLSEDGKFIFLRLQRTFDVKQSILHFFNAIPTAWYEEFGGILDAEGYAEVAAEIDRAAAETREESVRLFQEFLGKKEIEAIGQPINYSGTDEELVDAVKAINTALKENEKLYLTTVYGRRVRLPIPQATLTELKDAGLIWASRSSASPDIDIWC